MSTKEITKENARRIKAQQAPYNPLTGEGCYGPRFPLRLPETGTLYLPTAMKLHPDIQVLIKARSLTRLITQKSPKALKASKDLKDSEDFTLPEALIAFATLRTIYDFEYFACTAETIIDKLTAAQTPFILNKGQRKLLAALEDMRLKGDPVRIILLKARQWGGSTLTQLYMYWIQMRLKKGWNSVICAHTMDAAKNIRAMYKLCAAEMPPLDGRRYELIPFEGTLNIRQVPQRRCRITVGSAVEPDSVRSQDIKMAHFSEVALYPKTENTNARQLVTSIVSSVPAIPDTVVVHESTANGVGDFFHQEYTKAKSGNSPYRAVFVSWFELGNLYTISFDDNRHYNHSGIKTEGGVNRFIASMTDWELSMFNQHNTLTLEHLNWYRFMKPQFLQDMPKEFPSDDIEAFINSGETVFRASDIQALRPACNRPPVAVGVMTARGDAAAIKLTRESPRILTQDVAFRETPELLPFARQLDTDPYLADIKLNNHLVIWKHPDHETPCRRRYIVTLDPARGITNSADWGSICVLDRYWRIYGGKPEIVAEWRGHADKDVAVWTAVQTAIYYCNALLVIENNIFGTGYSREDENEFLIGTVADYYSNLYARDPADKLKENIPLKYGFNTNRSTKPSIINNYVATLRERAYVERSHRTLDQAQLYERKKDGAYAAREGHHDDDLMTRMISLYIDYHEYPFPELLDQSAAAKTLTRIPTNESSF